MKSADQKRNLIGPRMMQERQKRPAYDTEFYALAKALNVSVNWLSGRENV